MEDIIKFIGVRALFDKASGCIFGIDGDNTLQHIAEVRGYGAIQNLFVKPDKSIDFDAADDFQDRLGKFIAEAITEKINRINGK